MSDLAEVSTPEISLYFHYRLGSLALAGLEELCRRTDREFHFVFCQGVAHLLLMSRRILVIEDEQPIRTYLQKLLRRAGYDTLAATDGEEGLNLVRSLLPDLVLCDVVMPKLNGYGVLDALRRDRATAHIPFVFLSSKTGCEDIEQGLRLGSNAYLTKPIEQTHLLGTIAAQLV